MCHVPQYPVYLGTQQWTNDCAIIIIKQSPGRREEYLTAARPRERKQSWGWVLNRWLWMSKSHREQDHGHCHPLEVLAMKLSVVPCSQAPWSHYWGISTLLCRFKLQSEKELRNNVLLLLFHHWLWISFSTVEDTFEYLLLILRKENYMITKHGAEWDLQNMFLEHPIQSWELGASHKITLQF